MADSGGIDFATLLASSVHDMKNSVGMLVHLIEELDGRVDGASREFDLLRFESARLNQGLVQLMTLYKLEQGQYLSAPMEYFLDEFVDEQVLVHRPLLAPRGVAIERAVAAELSWHFDGQLVAGVLGNLLGNLLSFDGAEIRARASRVRISAAREDDCLRLRVEDDGPGYPEALLEAPALSQTAVDFKSGSTGFGLYFSRQVAAAHRNGDRRGYVRVSNGGALGGGRFDIYLP